MVVAVTVGPGIPSSVGRERLVDLEFVRLRGGQAHDDGLIDGTREHLACEAAGAHAPLDACDPGLLVVASTFGDSRRRRFGKPLERGRRFRRGGGHRTRDVRGGFSMPPKVVPRAPKSLTRNNGGARLWRGDFDDDGRGLVFPGSVADGGEEETSENVSEKNTTVGSVFTPRDDPFGDDAAREEIDLSEYEPGSTIVYDWKGDPMVIQPGDKLPNVM